MSLNAYFIGIIQVLVYAGAVMVLFLFIVMLLDLRAEEGRQINWLASAGGLAVALILLGPDFFCGPSLYHRAQGFSATARIDNRRCSEYRRALFGNYNLPFQIIGVLVLVATIGVVLLSKREPR